MLSKQLHTQDRGVSPVIAVILMVAITVILSAVIGTFVLDIGSSLSESPPQASFEVTIDEDYVGKGNPAQGFGNSKKEYTVLNITHAGGEPIDTDKLQFTFQGKRTWSRDESSYTTYYGDDNWRDAVPPGYNLDGEFTAGDTITLHYATDRADYDTYQSSGGFVLAYNGGPDRIAWDGSTIHDTHLGEGGTLQAVYTATQGGGQVLYTEEIPKTDSPKNV